MIPIKNKNDFPKMMYNERGIQLLVEGIKPCASAQQCFNLYGFICPGRFDVKHFVGSQCFGTIGEPHIRIYDKPPKLEEG